MSAELRAAAVRTLDREWAEALRAADELLRVFARLADAQRTLAGMGLHTTIRFDEAVAQQFWVVFQEASGDLVPREPLEAPIPQPEVTA